VLKKLDKSKLEMGPDKIRKTVQTPIITQIKAKGATDKNCRFSSVCCNSSVTVVVLPVYCFRSIIRPIQAKLLKVSCFKWPKHFTPRERKLLSKRETNLNSPTATGMGTVLGDTHLESTKPQNNSRRFTQEQ
jgi:hypothetical protein